MANPEILQEIEVREDKDGYAVSTTQHEFFANAQEALGHKAKEKRRSYISKTLYGIAVVGFIGGLSIFIKGISDDSMMEMNVGMGSMMGSHALVGIVSYSLNGTKTSLIEKQIEKIQFPQ